MAEHLAQVPVLKPREFLPDLMGIHGRFLPFGQILHIIFDISQPLKQLGFFICPLDFTILQYLGWRVRLMLPGRPPLVRQGIGLVRFTENIDGVPRLNALFPNAYPGLLGVHPLQDHCVAQARNNIQGSKLKPSACNVGD